MIRYCLAVVAAILLLLLVIHDFSCGRSAQGAALSIQFLGYLCNLSCVCANGFKMPVKGWIEETKRHKPMNERTRLRFLGDVIPLEAFGWSMKASIGDAFLYLGFLLLIVL